MLSIEPFDFSDEHYATMYGIDIQVFPNHPMSIEQWQHFDQTRDPKFLFQRELILRDGEVIAYGDYGQLPWAFHPQKVTFSVFIPAANDTPDIRPMYFVHVLEQATAYLADTPLIAIQNGAFSHWDNHLTWANANGFHEKLREQSSELDLQAFDPAAFRPTLERVQAGGIRIVSMRAYQDLEPDWMRIMYDLDWELAQDVPSAGTQTRLSFKEWQRLSLEGSYYDPDGWFVALDGDQAIGMSRGNINPEDSTLFNNFLTGVRCSYRRRGIATALKVHLITYAQRSGATKIQTFNEARNPMYQLNLQLGFEPKPAWVTFEKVLEGVPEAK